METSEELLRKIGILTKEIEYKTNNCIVEGLSDDVEAFDDLLLEINDRKYLPIVNKEFLTDSQRKKIDDLRKLYESAIYNIESVCICHNKRKSGK